MLTNRKQHIEAAFIGWVWTEDMDETDRSAPPKLSAQRQSLFDTAEYVKFLEKEFE
jgi:hypothetical protein